MKKSILIILAMTLSTLSSAYAPRGFGLDMSIQDSLQIIVPKDWGISISKSLVNKKVNWTGGSEWRKILEDVSSANNLTISYDEDNRAVEVVLKGSLKKRMAAASKRSSPIEVPVVSKKHFVYKKPASEKKTATISKADLSAMHSLAMEVDARAVPTAKSSTTPKKRSVFEEIKAEIGSLLSGEKKSATSQPTPKEEEVNIQDDTKLNYVKITPPKKKSKEDQEKKSFLSSLGSEIGSILSFKEKEKEKKQRELTKDEQNLKSLFQKMKYMVVDIYGYKSTSLRDNTVKFTFKLKTTEGETDSFIVFDGQSMYAPMIKKEEELIVLDWYSSNYVHPAAVIMEPVRPLSAKYKGEVDREIKQPKSAKVYFLKDPSYLGKRKYTIKAGTMLSKAIQNWADLVGIEVVWKSGADFKITKELTFYDGFLQSVEKVIRFYNTTKSPYQTRFFVKNKVLLVESLDIIYRNQK